MLALPPLDVSSSSSYLGSLTHREAYKDNNLPQVVVGLNENMHKTSNESDSLKL